MKKKLSLILFTSIFLFTCEVFGQPINSQIKDVVMAPPNATSLGKYGDIPIGLYTGTLNYTVPITTVEEGTLKLPVSLSYHSSGLKVGEMSSSVGLGWSLQAGGMISRTVQGLPDEAAGGYFSTGSQIAIDANGCITGPITNQNFASGTHDSEPDLFSFSVGGFTGKFYIDRDATNDGIANGPVVIIPRQDVVINYNVESSFGPYRLRNFTITTPDGNRYLFGRPNGASSFEGVDIMENNDNNFWRANGWHLKQIQTSDGLTVINLNYLEEHYRYRHRSSQGNISIQGGFPASQNGYFFNVADIQGWRLSRINSTTQTIQFFYNTNRNDLIQTNLSLPARELDQIRVQTGSYCKNYDLSQSYFQDNSVTFANNENDFQLKLNSVQEKSCSGSINIPAYIFDYYGKAGNINYLPNRLSSAIDHWGFYNDAASNPKSNLNIPTTLLSYNVGGTQIQDVKGSSFRESREEPMRWGVLKSIQYPTGGSTTIEYEANRYFGSRDSLSLQNQESLTLPSQCTYFYVNNPAATFIKTFTATTLASTRYTWSARHVGSFCLDPQGLAEIRVFNNSTNALIGTASFSANANNIPPIKEGTLTALIPQLANQAGVNLRFAIYGYNASSNFQLKNLTTTTITGNLLAGGLRVKKTTDFNGINSSNNVVKSYTYNNNVIPSQSSAILYSKPLYGFVFQGCTGSCNNISSNSSACTAGATWTFGHFFLESSIVPLSSFDGYHIGYSSVREYYNGTASGDYTLHQFFNDPAPSFDGRLPVLPTMPRIGSGELESKAERTSSNTDVAYTINYKNSEATSTNQGIFLRFVPFINAASQSSITFWRRYSVPNKPFRIAQSITFKDGVSTTSTNTFATSGHFFPIKETIVKSDGKTIEKEYKYFSDALLSGSLPAAQISTLSSLNLKTPIETTERVNGVLLKGSRTFYAYFANTNGAFFSTTTGGVSYFLRPFQFSNYEITYNASNVLLAGNWIVKGTINSYHGTTSTTGKAGFPAQFTQTGWQPENYQWTNSGKIRRRQFQNMIWNYNYHTGTDLLSSIQQPDGQNSFFYYDALARLSQKSSKSNNENTYYTYAYPVLSGATIVTPGFLKTQNNYTPTSGSALGTQEMFEYFDGLGRSIQKVNKGKVSGLDQVIAVSYDNRGRENRIYEPFASTNSSGAYVSTISAPFTLNEYESNPLNRIWKTTPPNWYSTINTYGTNTSADGVLRYSFNSNTILTYAANSLEKLTVIDPNGNKIITFTDKKARTILKRETDATESNKRDTYYLYDDKDRLSKVITPASTWSTDNFNFLYRYTASDQPSQKKVPGKAWETFEYNTRDLLVRYQDGLLASNARWMANQYDVYGRLIARGIYSSGAGDAIILANRLIENIYGTAGIEIDKIKTRRVMVFDAADPAVNPSAANTIVQKTFGYDPYGRVSTITGNNLAVSSNNSAETFTYLYDFGDNLRSEVRTSTNTGGAINVSTLKTYDAWGRLSQTSQSINSAPSTILNRNFYNAKDEISQKRIAPRDGAPFNGNGLQHVDFVYKNNGLLESINGLTNLTNSTYATTNFFSNFNTPSFSSTTNEDLFREVLEYDVITNGMFGAIQRNGNIGQQIWQTKGREAQAYGFTYDVFNRLINSYYTDYKFNGAISNSAFFNESFAYNQRGSVTTIVRNGLIKGASSYSRNVIDNLSFSYSSTEPTRISQITDTGTLTEGFRESGSTSTYVYDVNGNLTSDPDKGMTITYNHSNLPIKLEVNQNGNPNLRDVINFIYDAEGNKVRVIYSLFNNGNTTLYDAKDYIDGIEYKFFRFFRPEAIYNEDGRAFNTSSTGQVYRYEYYLKDHLGNVRVTFTDKNNDGIINNQTEILQENQYYPYGMDFDGPWYKDPAVAINPYKYQNRESLKFGGLTDLKSRLYNPAIGTFLQVDPLADEPEQLDKSPYVAFWNNPVIFDDPSGDCPRCVKTLAKTAVKSIIKGKLDLGDVYDLVDAGKTILDPNASLLDKGLAVFDIVSPISTKEIKAVGNILGVADNLNDAKKAGGKISDAAKINKNSNDAKGTFVLYKVDDVNGTPLKVGKADAERTNSSGFPVRAATSERKAQKTHPGATVSVIPGSRRTTTTGKMKEYEAKTVRGERAKGNELPLNKEKDKRYKNNQ